MIAHPRPNSEILSWLRRMLTQGAEVIVPEVTDYELQRNLLLEGLMESAGRLDRLKAVLTYLPLNTRTILRARRSASHNRRKCGPFNRVRSINRALLYVWCVVASSGIIWAQQGNIYWGRRDTPPPYLSPLDYKGDIWKGEVVRTDNLTREITLTHRKGDKSQSFIGMLREGYKVNLKDGSVHELKVSEIPIGTRLIVYYVTRTRDVGGKKEKYNRIFSMTKA